MRLGTRLVVGFAVGSMITFAAALAAMPERNLGVALLGALVGGACGAGAMALELGS